MRSRNMTDDEIIDRLSELIAHSDNTEKIGDVLLTFMEACRRPAEPVAQLGPTDWTRIHRAAIDVGVLPFECCEGTNPNCGGPSGCLLQAMRVTTQPGLTVEQVVAALFRLHTRTIADVVASGRTHTSYEPEATCSGSTPSTKYIQLADAIAAIRALKPDGGS